MACFELCGKPVTQGKKKANKNAKVENKKKLVFQPDGWHWPVSKSCSPAWWLALCPSASLSDSSARCPIPLPCLPCSTCSLGSLQLVPIIACQHPLGSLFGFVDPPMLHAMLHIPLGNSLASAVLESRSTLKSFLLPSCCFFGSLGA